VVQAVADGDPLGRSVSPHLASDTDDRGSVASPALEDTNGGYDGGRLGREVRPRHQEG